MINDLSWLNLIYLKDKIYFRIYNYIVFNLLNLYTILFFCFFNKNLKIIIIN